MNILSLSQAYLRRRVFNTALTILLMAMGIATITILLLFSHQTEENLYENARGVDLVAGAKGSPVQLILSSVFHMDAPTGNVSIKDARVVTDHQMVSSHIPLALGDNYQGRRVLGTTHDYIQLYEAELDSGRVWTDTFEVVLGSEVARDFALNIGDGIYSTHGLSDSGHIHDDHELKVIGILKPTGRIIDQLVLTSVQTMWGLHDHHDHDEEHDDEHHNHNHHHHSEENHHHHEQSTTQEQHPDDIFNGHFDDKEITALLISYRSPIAATQLPRYINSETNLQAASPAVEITRLLNLLGFGLDIIRIFGLVLIISAALGVFIALYNAMKQRQYDIAVMRSMGGSKNKLCMLIVLEGLWITLLGCILGLLLGHIGVSLIGNMYAGTQQLSLTGFIFIYSEIWIIMLALMLGIVASLIPAWKAYHTDISKTLSRV